MFALRKDNYSMRVLCVTLNYADAWGGTTLSVTNFAQALDADILSFTFEGLIPKARKGKCVYHIPVPNSLTGRLYSRPNAYNLRQATDLAHEYDVIICHMLFRYHNYWVTGLHKPYFVVPHGSLDPYVFTYRRLQKELWLLSIGSRFFSRAEAVIFATRREQEKAFRGNGSDNGKVISWGLKVKAHDGSDRAQIRYKLGIPRNARMLIALGRLHSMKRPMEMIEAFALAAQEKLHLVIAGPEEQYTVHELQTFAMLCGTRNVHIIGPVFGNEKWKLYRAADGYISMSARENFGYTLVEAMFAGLPTILSPGNDLSMDISGEKCSWELKTDTKEEAVRAIRSFAHSKTKTLHNMGERGRRWALKNATFDVFRSKIRELVFSQQNKIAVIDKTSKRGYTNEK